MQNTVFSIGSIAFSMQSVLIVILAVACLGALWSAYKARQALKQRDYGYDLGGQDDLEAKLERLMEAQGEMTGRMQTMAEIFGSRQADLMRTVNDRLDGMGKTLGASVLETHRQTHNSLRGLHERMATLDRAHKTMGELAGQVTNLQQIFSDKQARGAFGQRRMEQIIEDALAPSSFSFQFTLSNRTRPDCVVHMPAGAPQLVIDAKFPLEGYNQLQDAETQEDYKAAGTRFRRDITRHIDDISSKYLIAGETQETALMFVPSESVFAEIYENFPDLVQKAFRQHVVIVSPSLLMLSVQVVQSVLRDARMREQAHTIQAEVSKLLEDVGRLTERVSKLQTHYAQTNKDIEQILVSSGKIQKRGERIEELELGTPVVTHESAPPAHPAPELPLEEPRDYIRPVDAPELEEDELPPLYSLYRRK
ncbi:DNA recombination protein RmuC [Pseudovibrio flavus]|uniref:DNA recombination protein RmuC n=1 Tax=Pseudovibrio flavus TaxID=2529854 RepID=UPI00211C1890|nr:DNA recombination protein RmuC [Pseudovibrio flavus]